MKATEFQTLVGQLGELSKAQRSALLNALSGAKNADAVIRLIETQFDASPRCGHCGSELFQKWGVDAGLKRYKCKGCNKTFNALTGTPLATLKHRDRWLAYAKALVDGVSLRKAAKRARIDLTTAFRWRHRFLKVPKTTKAAAVTGIVEADETFFLKSAKGSKKLVGREPRKRGGTAKKKGLSTDEHAYGSYHIQNVNGYISRLKGWMRRFNGVATKYLDSYLGWRRMIDRMGDNLTPLAAIAAALPQPST